MAKGFQDRIDDLRGVKASFVILLLRIVMFLEDIRQAHCADFQACIHKAKVAGKGQDMRAETAYRCFFHGDHNFVRCDHMADQIFVQRLGKTQIGNAGAQALGVQRIRGLQRLCQTGAE